MGSHKGYVGRVLCPLAEAAEHFPVAAFEGGAGHNAPRLCLRMVPGARGRAVSGAMSSFEGCCLTETEHILDAQLKLNPKSWGQETYAASQGSEGAVCRQCGHSPRCHAYHMRCRRCQQSRQQQGVPHGLTDTRA